MLVIHINEMEALDMRKERTKRGNSDNVVLSSSEESEGIALIRSADKSWIASMLLVGEWELDW